MHFYPHHIGDYQRDTAHLSVTEHGVYRLLMDHYYATEKPLPQDLSALCRIIRATSKLERDAVAAVVATFFKASGAGLRHKRIENELAAYAVVKERNQNNGKKGGRPKLKPKPEPTQEKPGGLFMGLPNETEIKPSQEPLTKNQGEYPLTPKGVEFEFQLVTDPKPKKERRQFCKPTTEEWLAYAATLTPAFPPEEAALAFDHYESNGWKVGRNQMKDWRASVRTCHQRWKLGHFANGKPNANHNAKTTTNTTSRATGSANLPDRYPAPVWAETAH